MLEEYKEWVKNNQLRSIGLVWAATLAGSLAWQWSRPIPTQLKIIHSRIYAQAITVSTLGIAGLLSWGEQKGQDKQQQQATGVQNEGRR